MGMKRLTSNLSFPLSFFSKNLTATICILPNVESIINKVRFSGRERCESREVDMIISHPASVLPLFLSPSQTTIFCSYLWLLWERNGNESYVVRESQSCLSLIRKGGVNKGKKVAMKWCLVKKKNCEVRRVSNARDEKSNGKRRERIDWHEPEACLVIVLQFFPKAMRSRQWFDGYAHPLLVKEFDLLHSPLPSIHM